MHRTRPLPLTRFVSTLCAAMLIAAGCSAPKPQSTPTMLAPEQIASPTGVPVAASPPPSPTAAICNEPSAIGSFDLLPLPGSVREPVALAWLGNRLYVAGRTSGNIGIVEDDRLVGTLPVNGRPVALVGDESLGRLFALDETNVRALMFDGQRLLGTLPISNPVGGDYQSPAALIGDPQSHRLFAAVNSQVSEVVVIDAQTFSVSARLSLNSSDTIARLALDTASNHLLVSHYDQLTTFDLNTNQVIETIRLPGSAYRILLRDPRTGRVYIDQYTDASRITVLENNHPIAAPLVGADPYDATVAGDRLYVTGHFSDTVSVIDLTTNEVAATIATGPAPGAILASPNGDRAYVALGDAYSVSVDRLEVIDTQRNEVAGIIPLAARARQIVTDDTRQRLYALVPSANAVVVSDGQQAIAQIPLARTPLHMALDESTGRLFVTEYPGDSITVIDTNTPPIIERKTLNLPTSFGAIGIDVERSRLIIHNRAFSLDRLEMTGQYSITGYTVPYGDGLPPIEVLVNPSAPRFYAVSSNGVPGSNGGIVFYVFDSDTLMQITLNGDRNVTAYALDAEAQRLYAAVFHPMALTSHLNVLDAADLSTISTLALPARATTLVLNPDTHHAFLAYFGYRPSDFDNTIDVIDTRTLGRVTSFKIDDAELAASAVLNGRAYFASNVTNRITIVQDCESEAPPAPTPTPSPSPYPTVTPLPTATPAPLAVFTVTPPPCPVSIGDGLRDRLDRDAALRGALGCPIGPPRETTLAEQRFENGVMFWRADTRHIYVLDRAGTWAVYDDTWTEAEREGDYFAPPPGLIEPKRGFGKVWRDQLGGPNAVIGWAIEEEASLPEMQTQAFEQGIAFFNASGEVYILQASGVWR